MALLCSSVPQLGTTSQPVDILEHSLDAAHKIRGPQSCPHHEPYHYSSLEVLREHIWIPVTPACNGNLPPSLTRTVETTFSQLHANWVDQPHQNKVIL